MTGNIFIYGEVGKQVTLDTVLKDITPKATEYIVHIHSNGGDVFEGYAIYNAIRNTGKNITVHIEGVCASIATLIASAGQKIIMNTKSSFMIHNPRITSMAGDARDLRSVAAQLDMVKTQLIQSWVGRTSLTQEQLSHMYDTETWLTPEGALELGFIDEIREVLKAVASVDLKHINNMQDKSVLEAIRDLGKQISSYFKPKNATETLEDGRVINVPDGEEWIGQPVTLEDGSPLAAGEYPLASGFILVVGDNSMITEKRDAAPVDNNQEDMKQIEELKAQLETALARNKELESAVQATTTTAEKAEAKARSFENKFNTELKDIQDKLKKIENTTVGDTTLPDLGVRKPINSQPAGSDPMQAWFKQNIIDPRNTD